MCRNQVFLNFISTTEATWSLFIFDVGGSSEMSVLNILTPAFNITEESLEAWTFFYLEKENSA